MTGTAITEASEFGEIYQLEVIEVPTNKDMIHDDMDDEVYSTTREKMTRYLTKSKNALM